MKEAICLLSFALACSWCLIIGMFADYKAIKQQRDDAVKYLNCIIEGGGHDA